ncbi:unnamed protein product [Gordionus sp. m RMFG-2023]
MGDIGGIPKYPYTSSIGRHVAKELKQWSNLNSPRFVSLLGDNFYMHGVRNVADNRFKTSFEQLYNHSSLNSIPWYVLAGNHDHYGNVTAQMMYQYHSQKWVFPQLFYTKIYRISPGVTNKHLRNITLQLVIIDTVVMCYPSPPKISGEGRKYINDYTRSLQNLWLDTVLSNSKADILLVNGHHPVYSTGSHGPTKCLLKSLRPKLLKYNVSAYISGHDHSFQHLAEPSQNLNYFIIGSGSKLSRSAKNMKSNPKGCFKFRFDHKGGFGIFSINHGTRPTMKVSFRDSSGNIKYSVVITSREY